MGILLFPIPCIVNLVATSSFFVDNKCHPLIFADGSASRQSFFLNRLSGHLVHDIEEIHETKHDTKTKLLNHLGLEMIQDNRIILPNDIKDGLTTILNHFVTFFPEITLVFPEKIRLFLSDPSDFPSLLNLYEGGAIALSQIILVNLDSKCSVDYVKDISDILLEVEKVWIHSDQDVLMWRYLAFNAGSGNSRINNIYLSSGLNVQDENIDYIVDVCLNTPIFEINDINMEPKHWEFLSSKLQKTPNKTAKYMGLGFNSRKNFKYVTDAVLSVESVGLWNNFADTQYHWQIFFKEVEERFQEGTLSLKTIWIYEAYANILPSMEVKVKAKSFGIDIITGCKHWKKDCSKSGEFWNFKLKN